MRTLGLPLHVNLCAEATVMVLVYLACSKKRPSGVDCKAGGKCSSHRLPPAITALTEMANAALFPYLASQNRKFH